ncbi:hypothetical protein ACFY12_32260 [Streptomyces sp. NPDC001339]|uniref:hypothetical protein n=1 Tax=Streptomyces sp. NPDC001339 TaxID=3364563 RepID=UPI0036CFAECD
MTTLLEQRYRSLLRLLPSYYRRAREEEMVETYLCGIDESVQEEARPALGEVASILALAVRTRLAAPGAPVRYATAGAVVRDFAVFAVLVLGTCAVTECVLTLAWLAGATTVDRSLFTAAFTDRAPLAGAFAVAVRVLPLLWAAGYVCLMRGHRRAARYAVTAAAVPATLALVEQLAEGEAGTWLAFTVLWAAFTWLTVLAVNGGFHTDAPPPLRPAGRPGLVFAACCVLTSAFLVLFLGATDPVWAAATAFSAIASVWLAASRGRVEATAATALTALGTVVLVPCLSTLAQVLAVAPAGVVRTVVAQTALVALLVAVGAIVAVHNLTTVRRRSTGAG